MLSAPQLSNARGLGWDPLHPHAGGMLRLTAEVLPPPKAGTFGVIPPPLGVPRCPARGRIRPRYLQEQPLTAHHGGFAPVDHLGEGQLPAIAQQHGDAGGLHGTPQGLGQSPGTPQAGPLCPPQTPRVPAAPPGSGRSPGAGRGARCRRWSCAAAPGSRTWRGDVVGVGHSPPPTHVHPTGFCWHPTRPGTHPVGLGWTRAGFGPKKPPLHRAGGAAAPWEMPSKGTCCRARNQTHPKERVRRPPALPGGGGAQPPPHHPAMQRPNPRARNCGDSCAVPGLAGQERPCPPQQHFFFGGGAGGPAGPRAMKAPSVPPGGGRGAFAAGALRPHRKIQY